MLWHQLRQQIQKLARVQPIIHLLPPGRSTRSILRFGEAGNAASKAWGEANGGRHDDFIIRDSARWLVRPYCSPFDKLEAVCLHKLRKVEEFPPDTFPRHREERESVREKATLVITDCVLVLRSLRLVSVTDHACGLFAFPEERERCFCVYILVCIPLSSHTSSVKFTGRVGNEARDG